MCACVCVRACVCVCWVPAGVERKKVRYCELTLINIIFRPAEKKRSRELEFSAAQDSPWR